MTVRRLVPLGGILVTLGAGCISIATSVSKPTALERQLLGVYEELDRDLVLASSLRAPGPASSASYESLHGLARSARSIQRFNEDDVVELKAAGCLAESLEATVVRRSCPLTSGKDPTIDARIERVVAEENSARGALLRWAAFRLAREAGRDGPTLDESRELRRTYHRLLKEAATAGQLFETRRGVFEKITGE